MSNANEVTRRHGRDHAPALIAGARPDVDHPVACRDHAHVMLHHYDRVAGIDKSIELRDQSLDVGGMQTGGRLVKHKEGVAA